MTSTQALQADYLEAGTSGPLVVLLHSSVSGARQWRKLMDELKDRFRVRAVNLYGYGKSPTWTAPPVQSLADQAKLVESVLPDDARPFHLVGHSFGGSVAMMVASRAAGRVGKLVLLETNPFFLLRQAGRKDAFAEAQALSDTIKTNGSRDNWIVAAERFADYWGGANTWRDMSADRRAAFTEAIKPNFHEWDAVLNETTPIDQWSAALPQATLLVSDPATVRPIREIDELLRAANPSWASKSVAGGGHMAPLTRPDLINPVVASYLTG